MATPCIRLLHERFPDAELHFLTERKCTPVLENNPLLSKVWVIDKAAGLSGMLSLYSGIRRENYDLVVDFQQLIRLKLGVFLSGAPIRLTYKPKWYNRLFYNLYGNEGKGYASKAKAGVLGPLGVEWDGQRPELFLTELEKAWARDYLSSLGVGADAFLLTIDATHRRITRKWPEEYYAKLIRMVAEKYPQVRMLMLYGPGEKDVVDNIVAQAGNPSQCLVPQDQTTLRQMAAILERANGHFGNCSSPRHFAVAVGTRSLIIQGSNKPGGWTFPSEDHAYIRNEHGNNPCLGCNKSECRLGTLECLYELEPEAIFKRLESFFFQGMD
ncbi:glycosyltransferase family 9 protein [Salidesulfovibrio onnuriiensis]|uniref:glycosyltransferase family 9 protein n=1 Tax=Salidesulfovibrio onnuriiensis TaxID=2583823 RepID=UPI00202B6ED3|nr:glycosyltransferase family 9 protein [Salidesulfovibrio onnuriiensis]